MNNVRSNDIEKALIISEIRRLATENGRAPGMEVFAKATGIGKHRWYGVLWARWSDALEEAGQTANRMQAKLDSAALLELLANEVRRIGRMPTHAELRMQRANDGALPHPEVFGRHFGGQNGVIEALVEFCRKQDYADVLAVLPQTDLAPQRSPLKLGHVYLMQSGQHYKIGRTDTLERRFKEITVAMPDQVTIEHTISTDDPPGIEAYWHRRFADRRVNGEWFKLSREDVSAFRRRKFQ